MASDERLASIQPQATPFPAFRSSVYRAKIGRFEPSETWRRLEMSKTPKTPQQQAQDRKQKRVFESTYEYLVRALQSFDPSVRVGSEPLRVGASRDLARGAITIRYANKRANLPVSMQNKHVWVNGEKVHALPKTAPKSRLGYYFENRESAASYFIAVAQSLSKTQK